MTDYSKFKGDCEKILNDYTSAEFETVIIRPATVCGLSPRMRLDVSVNMLTFQALKNGKITVFGGQQTRPNIHINDMVNVYRHFIGGNDIPPGCYNAGFENISILEIANAVRDQIDTEIVITESNDPRSYRQNSDKLISTGFKFKYNVDNAIEDIISKYKNKSLEDNEIYYNLNVMKKLGLGKIKKT